MVTSQKKAEKKACQSLASSATGDASSDKCPHFAVQKKFKNVKKKLVRAT
jgi:hypothetical protein